MNRRHLTVYLLSLLSLMPSTRRRQTDDGRQTTTDRRRQTDDITINISPPAPPTPTHPPGLRLFVCSRTRLVPAPDWPVHYHNQAWQGEDWLTVCGQICYNRIFLCHVFCQHSTCDVDTREAGGVLPPAKKIGSRLGSFLAEEKSGKIQIFKLFD